MLANFFGVFDPELLFMPGLFIGGVDFPCLGIIDDMGL